ncbi:rRNA pseudouridine synthase [Candidatus Saccharibacteria bacterium]|nr:rRNA pseudouridine synthase [Candidatus Saccharibacteria bacterium]
MEAQRLNKYLATNFGVSRREADILIEQGKVKINGKVAEIGQRVEAGDKVLLDGKEIAKQELIYVALNKPVGYVCSRKRQGDTPTIYELLPDELQSLKSVGRLDKDSSGLILLTNDGDFAFQMTHPKFYKHKKYTVTLDRELAPLHQQMISDFGINLPDGLSKMGLERLDDSRKHWDVTLGEGRNRQIRRTFEALGYKVVALHRYQFDNYSLSGLESGEWTRI